MSENKMIRLTEKGKQIIEIITGKQENQAMILRCKQNSTGIFCEILEGFIFDYDLLFGKGSYYNDYPKLKDWTKLPLDSSGDVPKGAIHSQIMSTLNNKEDSK